MSDPGLIPLRFRGIIEAARGGGAVIPIPAETAAALGGTKRMRVLGTLNGTSFRSSTMPYRDVLYLGVHKATREAARVGIGDEVEITLSRDDAPRVVEIPPELAAALSADPDLRARFDRLSFTQRRECAGSIAEAKRPETRARRLEATLETLRQLG